MVRLAVIAVDLTATALAVAVVVGYVAAMLSSRKNLHQNQTYVHRGGGKSKRCRTKDPPLPMAPPIGPVLIVRFVCDPGMVTIKHCEGNHR
jgi:hypothetical protein